MHARSHPVPERCHGASLLDLGRHLEALAASEEALALYRDLAAAKPARQSDLARVLNSYGATLMHLGRHREALAVLEEALALYRDPASGNAARQPDLARALNSYGATLMHLGRHREALAVLEEALALYRDLAAANPAYESGLATCPDHPRTVQAPELLLDRIVGRFFADRIFGPGRAELLAAQLPATDADAIADRDVQAARLQARIKRIEIAQNSQILELEQLPADPADTASAAMRARIRARFADLHHEREQIETQLTALANHPRRRRPGPA